MDEADPNAQAETTDEFLEALASLDPESVLTNLSDHINSANLPLKRLQDLDRRYIDSSTFTKLKDSMAGTRELKNAVSDLTTLVNATKH